MAVSVVELFQDDEFAIPVTWSAVNGDPIDITGYAISAELRWPGGTYQFAVDVTDGAAGEFNLTQGFDFESVPVNSFIKLNIHVAGLGGLSQTIAYQIKTLVYAR